MQDRMYVDDENHLEVIDKICFEKITFENCHLVVEYFLLKKPELSDAIMNEFNAQIRFGDNR